MEFITVLVDNYKTSTKDFNIFVKIILALLFAFIIFAVGKAIVNVLVYGV